MLRKSLAIIKNEFRSDSVLFRHAVRGALALTLAMALARGLGLKHAVWLPISVMVIMRPSVGGTLRHSWRRLTGTVLGAALGILILFFKPALGVSIALVVLLFFLTIMFKVYNYTAFSCTLTAAVILLLGIIFADGWEMGLERIIDTVLGVTIGLGASFLVWPNMARKNLRAQMGDLIHAQYNHFKQLSESYLDGMWRESDLVESRIAASMALDICAEFFHEASAEPGLQGRQRQDLFRLLRVFTRMHRMLTAMSSTIRRSPGGPLEAFEKGMRRLLGRALTQYRWLERCARDPEHCSNRPHFDRAVDEFLDLVGEIRARGELEEVPLERRNNISAFIWQIRTLGNEIKRAERRLNDLRGRSSN